jgi:aspartate racemase
LIDAPDPGRSPSIGRPLPGLEVYVVDPHHQPVPIGVTGELVIGGRGLARGYRRQPELTAEKFVPHAFSPQPGARCYRTGDLARYLSDGRIEFLGRRDHQAKIRGYRIELGEIEATLRQHAAVVDAAVIPRPANDALVAYVVIDRKQWDGDRDALVSLLRSHLATTLPEYMTPAIVTEVERLPLTPNGKVDRRALQAASHAGTQAAPHVPARDDLERALCRLWAKVLGVEQVGIRDNFFELGGHSLLAARLFAQIENRFQRKLPLAALFQAPTIEQQTVMLRGENRDAAWSSLVSMQPEGTRPPLFCVHAAGANVLIYRPLARRLAPEQPVYALQAVGLDGRTTPYTAVERMASHYLTEIRKIQPAGPYFLLGGSFGGLVCFEMAQQLAAQGQHVALLAMLNTNCPVYSTWGRLKCHLGHLKKDGLLPYLKGATQGLQRRLIRRPQAAGVQDIPDRALQDAVRNGADTDDPLIRTVLAIFEAESSYVPTSYPGKVTFFWAKDAPADFEDNRLAWRKLAAGGLEIHEVPGTHTSIREEPNVAVLTEQLMACLDRAQPGDSARFRPSAQSNGRV